MVFKAMTLDLIVQSIITQGRKHTVGIIKPHVSPTRSKVRLEDARLMSELLQGDNT